MKKFFVMLCGLGLISAVFLMLSRQRVPQQTVLLPDGSEMTFLGTTYGTNHQFATSKGPFQLLLRHLPATWFRGIKRAPVVNNSYGQKDPFLMIWFLWENAPANIGSLCYTIADANQESTVQYFSGDSANLTTNRMVIGTCVTAFPRRAAQLQFHLKQRNNENVPVGDFVIPNPVKQDFTEWKAEPLPCTKTDGDFSATLLRVVANAGDDRKLRLSKNQEDLRVFLSFETRQGGKPTNIWAVAGIDRKDATGNTSFGASWSSPETEIGRNVLLNHLLWPDEPAWKLRVEFSREKNFTSDELVSFPAIPVPEKGRYTEADLEKTVQGMQVILKGITAPDVPLPGNTSTQGDQFAVHIQVSPLLEGYRLTEVKFLNEEGKRLRTGGTSSNGAKYMFPLVRDEKAKTVEVTVALHKSRFVEFIAKPEMIPTTNTATKSL